MREWCAEGGKHLPPPPVPPPQDRGCLEGFGSVGLGPEQTLCFLPRSVSLTLDAMPCTWCVCVCVCVCVCPCFTPLLKCVGACVSSAPLLSLSLPLSLCLSLARLFVRLCVLVFPALAPSRPPLRLSPLGFGRWKEVREAADPTDK